MEPAPKRKVLLVDDSMTMLAMEEMLLRRSYDIIKATSGTDALRIAAEQHPDVILLDIVMANMDGLETCRLLRSMAATKATPIIMVTTRSEDDALRDAYLNGATDYVTKPIDAKTLLGKIKHHLGPRP